MNISTWTAEQACLYILNYLTVQEEKYILCKCTFNIALTKQRYRKAASFHKEAMIADSAEQLVRQPGVQIYISSQTISLLVTPPEKLLGFWNLIHMVQIQTQDFLLQIDSSPIFPILDMGNSMPVWNNLLAHTYLPPSLSSCRLCLIITLLERPCFWKQVILFLNFLSFSPEHFHYLIFSICLSFQPERKPHENRKYVGFCSQQYF